MKKRIIILFLITILSVLLSACRFAVVETGGVVIEAPTPTPEATPTPEPETP